MKSELAGNAVSMQVPDAEYATGFLWQRHGSHLQSLPLALRAVAFGAFSPSQK